ncbi:MAG: selenocysteine-specific translation elongation factor, partial [Chloroflexi bacterium]|nr:selenocysteine-specific translation elongation factor [Chloroflexota bacterium]
MIVATAGHVDHGKTSLIRALTGVDTDRLPEERARGMTIDLGFAYLPLPGAADPDEVIGFVDVPGHERFVRNMLAGVAGIDFALLVVAADDGPMPQTQEHLAILDLLGVAQGAVALTKVDRVSSTRVDEVTAQIAALLAPTTLARSPVVPCAAPSGIGIDALRALLQTAQTKRAARATDGGFRLAIDRSFLLDGAGRVVTGTVYSGTVSVGDALVVAPSGLEVRVRGIHSQNRQATEAGAGLRCGINLAGADLRRYELHRGDWLVTPALASCATRLGVTLQLSASEARALRDRTPVHVHLGAADVGGRVGLLRDGPLAPGEACQAVLTLDAPLLAVRGDRFVIRDQSATRTLGGGTVLEPVPFPRALSRSKRLALHAAMRADSPALALEQLIANLPEGIEAAWFARCWNLSPDTTAMLSAAADLHEVPLAEGDRLLVPAAGWESLCAAVLAAIGEHHQQAPAQTGLPEPQLAAALAVPASPRLRLAATDALVRAGRLQRKAGQLCLPGHRAVLPAADLRLLDTVCVELRRL